MRLSFVIVTLCIAQGVRSQEEEGFLGKFVEGAQDVIGSIFGEKKDFCSQDISKDYRHSQVSFYKSIYQKLAVRSNNHFVFSPYMTWLTLSALAEGSDPIVQTQIFGSLYLPQEKCLRQRFYDTALNVERPNRDIRLKTRRNIIVDDSLRVNPTWAQFVSSSGLLDVTFAPISTNTEATAKKIRRLISTRSDFTFGGNSILLDSFDFRGLWTTAFPEGQIKPEPFYNDQGQQIGTVDMMRIRKRVRIAREPFSDNKILELPMGENGRFTMLMGINSNKGLLGNAFDSFIGSSLKIFSLLEMSVLPLDVAIPIFAITSEFDARAALEDIGVVNFWKNPAATSYISSPPALPGGLIQRATVKIGSAGIEPAPTARNDDIFSGLFNFASNTATGFVSALGHDFVANRPFMYVLFDTKTKTYLFAGAFSKPQDARF